MERLDSTPVISSFLPARKPVFVVMEFFSGKIWAELSHAKCVGLAGPLVLDVERDVGCESLVGGARLGAVWRCQIPGRFCAFRLRQPQSPQGRRDRAGAAHAPVQL